MTFAKFILVMPGDMVITYFKQKKNWANQVFSLVEHNIRYHYEKPYNLEHSVSETGRGNIGKLLEEFDIILKTKWALKFYS